MKRLRVEGTVIQSKRSQVRKSVYYITAQVDGWGEVKYVGTRNRKEGERVVLQDQKARAMHDMIRWQEVRGSEEDK